MCGRSERTRQTAACSAQHGLSRPNSLQGGYGHEAATGAAFRVEKSEQILQAGRIGTIAQELPFPRDGDQTFALQRVEVMGQGGRRYVQTLQDLTHYHAIGVGGKQTAHDAEPCLVAEGSKLRGEA